ncbi:MAG: hypothetical protein H6737_02470 [Alphaproteobacteria bacterium]|nr:hypothetical protein [Alphaproteobacteria bacterium]
MAHEDQKTEMYSQMDWREPVKTRSDLPDLAEEGECCYVQDESAIYAFREGGWIKEIAKENNKSPEP